MNENKNSEQTEGFQAAERLIEKFCADHHLQVKATKEVHFLCLQLEKMMKEDILKDEQSGPAMPDFGTDRFQQPTE